MNFPSRLKDNVTPILVALFPIALWLSLWLSISAGNPGDILTHQNPLAFLQGLRALIPFIAAGTAVAIMGAKIYHHRLKKVVFIGPLGLTALYGLAGLLTSILSPDGSLAFYWAALYLCVPLVLWGLSWGDDPLGQIYRIVNFTWVLLILGTMILFAIALIFLDLGNVILHPAGFFGCERIGHWLTQTSGLLRSTGVGRYAALVALVSLSGIWIGRFRFAWSLLLLGSLMLLSTTGARTAMLGLVAAAPVVILLYSGKKAAVAGLAIVAVFVPLYFGVGLGQTALNECFLHKGVGPGEITTAVAGRLETPKKQSVQQSQTAPITTESQTSEVTLEGQPPGQQLQSSPITSEGQTSEVTLEGQPPGQQLQSSPITSEGQTSEVTLEGQPPGQQLQSSPITSEGQVPTPTPSVPAKQQVITVTNTFSDLSGRRRVWQAGIQLIKESPALGYGFHGDRLILGTQMHNTYLHAMLQTGLVGTIPLVAAFGFAWLLLLRALLNLGRLPGDHKHVVIQMAGLLTFLSVRTLPESTGAFFGVDWLLLALVMIYLQTLNHRLSTLKERV